MYCLNAWGQWIFRFENCCIVTVNKKGIENNIIQSATVHEQKIRTLLTVITECYICFDRFRFVHHTNFYSFFHSQSK